MNRYKKLAATILSASLLAAALAGCASNGAESGSNAGSGKNVFHYSVQVSVPDNIDPINSTDSGRLKFIRNTYETLVQEKVGTVEIEPLLAESWEIVDPKTWTFKLREGITFTDGSEFNADAVQISIERIKAIGGGISGLVANIEDVEVADPRTVTIRLVNDDVNFLYSLAKIAIVSPTAVKAHEKDNDYGKSWLAKNSAGTGPYQVSEWAEGQHATLKRYDGYWRGWKDGQINEITIQGVPDAATDIQLLDRGEIDKLEVSITDSLDLLEKNDNLDILKGNALQTYIFTFNTSKAPLNNKKVRQAISYAFDYKAVADKVYSGYAVVPRGFLPEGFDGFDETIPEQTRDIEKAKLLLQESGEKVDSLDLYVYEGRPDQTTGAQILQDNLRELGITLNIKNVSWQTLVEANIKGDSAPDMSALNMGAFTGDAIFFLQQNFDSKNIGQPYNWSFYKNDQFDAVVRKAASTVDKEERNKLLAEAQHILVDEAPALYWASPSKVEAINNRFKGYVLHPLDYFHSIRFYDLTTGAKDANG